MLDITNNETRSWLQNKLTKFVSSYHVDALYLDLGDSVKFPFEYQIGIRQQVMVENKSYSNFFTGSAYDLPKYYQFKRNLTNPDHYKAMFTDCALNAVPVLGVSSAISRPPVPVFLSLPSLQSTWESLQVIIPTTLTYGIVGYPFLMPGPVGGDYVSKSMRRTSSKQKLMYPAIVDLFFLFFLR